MGLAQNPLSAAIDRVHGTRIARDIADQLTATGRYDAADAKVQGLLFSRVMQSLASRSGVSADALYDRYRLEIMTVDGDLAAVEAQLNQAAFHGSPHRGIEESGFRLDRIGTGEGVQAYGWGLYFASRRGVAEHYRESLAGDRVFFRGEYAFMATPEHTAARAIAQAMEAGRTFEQAKAEFIAERRFYAVASRKEADDLRPHLGVKRPGWGDLVLTEESVAHVLNLARLDDERADVAESIVEGDITINRGQVYQVDIPDDDHLLDWDARMADQPQRVREALLGYERDIVRERIAAKLARRAEVAAAGGDTTILDRQIEVLREEEAEPSYSAATGETYYRMLAERLGTDQQASVYLRSLGILGLRYFDGVSRQAGEGSCNYVIWDEAAIAIQRTFHQSAIAADVTQTPAFRRWFGASKAVDADGRPLTVYHGTSSDVVSFGNARGNAFYFTDDPAAASVYATAVDAQEGVEAGPNVIPAYVRIENPLILDGEWQRREMADPHGGDWDWEVLDNALYEAEEAGHDGAILRGFVDFSGVVDANRMERPYDQYVVFDRHQIKSAIANRGTFDRTNASILLQSAVDAPAGGLPLVYHGTNVDFEQFRTPAYFTADRRIAQAAAYAVADGNGGVPRVLAARLDLRNPKLMSTDEIEGLGYVPEAIVALRADGYDGAVNESLTELVAFEPSQIRLVSDLPPVFAPTTLAAGQVRGATPVEVQDASSHFNDNYAPGEAGHADPRELQWVCVSGYPIGRLADAQDGAWFAQEQAMAAEDGRPGQWDALLREPIAEPIVVFDDGGRGFTQDGYHRVAASVAAGRASVPALVGFRPGTLAFDMPTTETEAFRAWFRESKIVDEQGAPLVVYHGTDRDFEVFRTDTDGAVGQGAYFSNDPRTAAGYATRNGASRGGRTVPVYLSLQRPFEINGAEKHPTRKQLERRGYDGIAYRHTWNDGSTSVEYVAFRPEQIKSAIANATFSPASGNLLFQAAAQPAVDEPAQDDGFWPWFGRSAVTDESGQPRRVYHGTFGDFDTFDPAMRGSATGAPSAFGGFFFASNRDVATSYASRGARALREAQDEMPGLRARVQELSGEPVERARFMLATGRLDEHPHYAELEAAFERMAELEDAEASAQDDYFADHSLDEQGRVHEVYLSLRNPLVHDQRGELERGVSFEQLIARAKAEGRDGLIVRNTYDTGLAGGHYDDLTDVYVAFEPEQIRAAGPVPPVPPPSPANTQARSRVGSVVFDAREGMGAVPDNGNVDYLGFVVMMKPSQFLRLASPLHEPKAAIRDAIRDGASVGPAFLQVDFRDEIPRVLRHEGRNRMHAVLDVNGDAPVPVHIFGYGDRAHDITPEKIEAARRSMVAEKSDTRVVGTFLDAFHRGTVHAAPSAFAQWFGNSRVVDYDGKPLKVYHGTIGEAFTVFKRLSDRYRTQKRSINAVGSWFTDAPADASMYAGDGKHEHGHVMPVYLSIQKPFRIRNGDGLAAMWQGLAGGNERLQDGDPERFRAELMAQGYDGLVMEASEIDNFLDEGSQYWVAFHPEQIKSATANVGTFDLRSPDILLQAQPEPSAFERWFEGSAVVDVAGRPQVVYHGTLSSFDEPDTGHGLGFHVGNAKQASDAALRKRDHGWTRYQRNVDEAIGGEQVMPLYAAIRNPLRLPDLEDWVPYQVVAVLKQEKALPDDVCDRLMAAVSPPWEGEIAPRGHFEAIRSALEAAGYDGIVYRNEREGTVGGFRRESSGDSWIAFRPWQLKSATANRGSFDPAHPSVLRQARADADAPRAALARREDRTFAVGLFPQADRTSFLHESGHVFLEVMCDLAGEPGADAQLREDFDAVMRWGSVPGASAQERRATWLSWPVARQRHLHEAFAEGFERYLQEGRAPAPELEGVFARFKGWITGVYRAMREVRLPMTDEIRGVMDRLVAGDPTPNAAVDDEPEPECMRP